VLLWLLAPVAACCRQDLFYTTILAALMGYTRPCKTLARAKPVNRVLSAPLMVSLVLQLAVIIVFQVCHQPPPPQHSAAQQGRSVCLCIDCGRMAGSLTHWCVPVTNACQPPHHAAVLPLQLIALASLHRVPWYTPTMGTTDLRTYVAPETSVIYLTNLAQYVILAVVFNKGHPHR
jgi:hypothetical protein